MFFFIPARILVEDLLLVDPAEGVGERRQKCSGREFQVEHDGRRIGRLDRVDHHVMALARAQDALGRMDDVVPARRHVRCGQRRPVVKLDTLADLEGVGLAVIGRLRHRRAQIADEVGRRRRVVRIDADQHAVKGCGRMHGREGALAVGIKARRSVRRDHVGQGAAVFRVVASACWKIRQRHSHHCHPGEGRDPLLKWAPVGACPRAARSADPWAGVTKQCRRLGHYLSSQTVARSWLM